MQKVEKKFKNILLKNYKILKNKISKLIKISIGCVKKILLKIYGLLIIIYQYISNKFYKGKNPYFLDLPVEKPKNDYIGFDAQVDALYQNIKNDAKMIGIIADYGSGKSSLVGLLKKKLGRIKYKVIIINLWHIDKDLETLDGNEDFVQYIHK